MLLRPRLGHTPSSLEIAEHPTGGQRVVGDVAEPGRLGVEDDDALVPGDVCRCYGPSRLCEGLLGLDRTAFRRHSVGRRRVAGRLGFPFRPRRGR